MKIKNGIFIIECVLITIMACVTLSLLKEELSTSAHANTITEETATESVLSDTDTFMIDQLSIDAAAEVSPAVDPASQQTASEPELSTVSSNETYDDHEYPANLPKVDLYSISGNTIEDGELNIVVFGDSIWDDQRFEDGVANHLAQMTGANVYNCSMGGTSAALTSESHLIEKWDTRSLNGMTYIATGRADAYTQLTGYEAKNVIEKVDFSKVDYFIFSYGLNDYFSEVEIVPEDLFDMTSYVGALRHAVHIMRQEYPQARYLIMSPTYCQFYYYDELVDDSNTKDFGEGTLEDYVDGAAQVAEEYNTLYLDAYHDFGITPDTASRYLRDGVHFTAEGRLQYATMVSEFINYLERYREN